MIAFLVYALAALAAMAVGASVALLGGGGVAIAVTAFVTGLVLGAAVNVWQIRRRSRDWNRY